MNCPACNSTETGVVDSRIRDEGTSIRRRRKCASCQHRFTTFEVLAVAGHRNPTAPAALGRMAADAAAELLAKPATKALLAKLVAASVARPSEGADA